MTTQEAAIGFAKLRRIAQLRQLLDELAKIQREEFAKLRRIAKLRQLPEPLAKLVLDFINLLLTSPTTQPNRCDRQHRILAF